MVSTYIQFTRETQRLQLTTWWYNEQEACCIRIENCSSKSKIKDVFVLSELKLPNVLCSFCFDCLNHCLKLSHSFSLLLKNNLSKRCLFTIENLNTLTQKNTSNHHYQLIPGLHQCWGGQGKQSCRLAPPGELLKVFAGHN